MNDLFGFFRTISRMPLVAERTKQFVRKLEIQKNNNRLMRKEREEKRREEKDSFHHGLFTVR